MTASRYSLPPHIVKRLQQLSVAQPSLDDLDQPPPTPWACAAAEEALTALVTTAPEALDTVFIAGVPEGGLTLEWGTDDSRQLIVSIPPRESLRHSIFRYSLEPRLEEDLPVETLAGLPELLSWLISGDGVRGRQFVNVRDIEERWDEQLAAAGNVLLRMAEQAVVDERAGRTAPLDLDDR